jgi:hypothetical protein
VVKVAFNRGEKNPNPVFVSTSYQFFKKIIPHTLTTPHVHIMSIRVGSDLLSIKIDF